VAQAVRPGDAGHGRGQGAEPTQTQAALEWTYKPGGLALIGETRSGKTRTAYLICRREFMAGKSVALFPCGEFQLEMFQRLWWADDQCGR